MSGSMKATSRDAAGEEQSRGREHSKGAQEEELLLCQRVLEMRNENGILVESFFGAMEFSSNSLVPWSSHPK